MDEQKHRIPLDFSAEAFQELKQITTQGRCESYAEAIRFGLALFRWFIEQMRIGNEVFVRGKDGSEEKIVKIGGKDLTNLAAPLH